jgi:hypothetical protein
MLNLNLVYCSTSASNLFPIILQFPAMILEGLAHLTVPAIALERSCTSVKTQLIGRAILPASTFATGSISGQFLNLRNDGTLDTATNFNGISFPFKQQPVQGFSGILPGPKAGTYFVLADNGYGAKANSADFLLRFYALEPDFKTGQVYPIDRKTGKRLTSFTSASLVQLNDKNNKLQGFQTITADRSTYPNSDKLNPNGISIDSSLKQNRLLTGADFDPESFRRAPDGSFWFGDELGPFLLHTDANGTLLEAPVQTPNPLDSKSLVRSPDHPTFSNLPDADRIKSANLARSKGFEGLALSIDGRTLYPFLEGAIATDSRRDRLFIAEFDLRKKQYTGKTYAYRLEAPNYAIGDLTAINSHEFLVIERDTGSGDASNPAFKDPAKFKRIYKIDLRKTNVEGFVAKELIVDLLRIDDPKNLGGDGTKNGVFTFPFVTIENVLLIDQQTLLVVNDNNYPSTSSRTPGKSDNTEFIKIRLSKPLNKFTHKRRNLSNSEFFENSEF